MEIPYRFHIFEISLDCRVRFVYLYYDLYTFKLDVAVATTLSTISLIAPFRFLSIPYRVVYRKPFAIQNYYLERFRETISSANNN